MKLKLFLATTLMIGTTAMLLAEDNRPPQGNRPSGSRPSGSPQGGQGGGQRPPFPIVDALDANKDHVIDAGELANAVAALQKLDKNGDGKLTLDEYMPARPSGGQGGPGGQGSQTGEGRPRNSEGGPNGRPQAPQ
jgi:hypothetical protein